MNLRTTQLDGVVILEPDVHGDDRGYFFESYSRSRFNKLVRPVISYRTTNPGRATA